MALNGSIVQADLFEEQVRPLFEQYRADYLARARQIARQIAMRNGEVTINDVREHCPPPEGVDPRVMGAILRKPEFIAVGYTKSHRSVCHNRPICIFKLANNQSKEVW